MQAVSLTGTNTSNEQVQQTDTSEEDSFGPQSINKLEVKLD